MNTDIVIPQGVNGLIEPEQAWANGFIPDCIFPTSSV